MQPNASPTSRPDRRRPAAPPLRGVAGGYDISRWPITVAPLPDELPVSWLWRVANRYGMTSAATLAALGLPQVNASIPRLETYLRRHADALAAALGTQPFPVDELPSSDGAFEVELERYAVDYRIGRLPAATIRFCPQCLAESGGAWLRSWRRRTPAACPTHGVQLLVRCHGCGAVPFSRSIWMTAATPPWICPQLAGQQPRSRRRRNRCGYDLHQAPASPLVALEADTLGRLHTSAEAASAHSLEPVDVAGFGVTARDHLDAIFELIDEDSDLTQVLAPDATGRDRLLSSARLAFEVLDQPTAHAAADIADRHGLLDPNGRHTPIMTDASARRRPHNPLLAAIRLRSLENVLSPTAQLTFRLASSMPRYPEPIPWWPDQVQYWLEQVPLAVIPQVLWPGTLTPWIQDDDIPARAAAAMLLAKLGSTRAWSLIALDLGLPAAFATTPSALVTRMRRNGTWQPLLRALEDLAAKLVDSPPLIDYSARRWAAAPTLIEQAVQSIEIDAMPEITVDRDQLAVLLWQTYTGGDARYHLDYRTDATLEARTTSRTHDALVNSLIERAAAELHHLTGQPDHGPLEWRPP